VLKGAQLKLVLSEGKSTKASSEQCLDITADASLTNYKTELKQN